jgi:hypothetical protein
MNQTDPIIEQKKVISSLFSKAKISKVAYIDDRFDTDKFKDEFVGSLMELYKSNKKVENIGFVEWDIAEPVFTHRIAEIWEKANDPERNEFLEKIYEAKGADEEVTNISGVINLPEYLKDFIIPYSPATWEKEKEIFFGENANGEQRVLCIFDKELEQGKDGIKLLEEVLLGKYYEKTYCAVFSQHVSIGNEFRQKKKWVEEKNISDEVANKFYPISKETLQVEPWGFIEGIKNVLVVEEIEKLKKHSKEIIQKAQKKVVADLENLTPESYNQIIQRSSKIEGVWEMNTLFRVTNILQDNALKTSITKVEERIKFNSSISTIRDFDEIKIKDNPVRWNEQTEDLRGKEIFESGDIINTLHYPLANGDIFQLGTKEYILIAQPCNLSFRKGGKRENNFELVSLVQLFPKQKGKYCEQISSLEKWVRFPSNSSIKLDVLDLAAYDDEGICKIQFEKKLQNDLSFHQPALDRYEKLIALYSKCAATLDDLQEILDGSEKRNQYQHLLKPVITLNSSFTGLPRKPYNIQNKEFNFNIKRTKRLKEPYSTHLLQQFMLYLSRNAFEHDISRSN